MVDSGWRRAVKAAVRAVWAVEYAMRRRLRPPAWRLGGACGGCAKCCEAPSIRAGFVVWFFPTARRLFLAWQRVVNGFVLVEARARTFTFRCTHFVGRRCDSYASRPFMCRDYPRGLLDQAWPELFPDCGFRPVARRGGGMAGAVSEELGRKLRVRE